MVVAMNEEENMDVDEAPAPKQYVKPSVLDTFNQLRDTGENFHLDGGAKLLAFLARSEDETNLQYTLKRIVRSMGANQLSMRTGYFSTLVLLLRQSQNITVDHLIKLVKQELHASGSKSEVGDVSVGQILVCGAVLRSGLILRASKQEQQDILTALLSASSKKSYLKSAAYLFLVDFVDTLDEVQFSSIVWNNIKTDLKKSIQEQTIDSLYLLIKCEEKFSSVIKVRKFLGVDEILCEDTIHTICEKLMNVTDLNQTNHPVYEYIGKVMANSNHLKLFWTSGIDSQLAKHNRNRELVAMKILTSILENIRSNYETIPELLTKNVLKLSIDWFKGLQTATKFRNKRDDEDDNKMMVKKEREVFNALAKSIKPEEVPSSVKIEVLNKLLFNPGDMNIAEITSTSIIKNVIVSLDKKGVAKAAKLFRSVLLHDTKKFVKEDTERAWFNYERLKASEYLSQCVNHPAVIDNTDFRLRNMKILLCFGFFKFSSNKDIAISADLSAAIKTSFYRCLNTRLPTVEGFVEILHELCNFIDEQLSNEQVKDKLGPQFPEENLECWIMLKRVCDKIEKKADKKKVDNVFLILLYQLGLFLFSEPKHVEIAKESIKELASCYDRYKKDGKNKKKFAKEGDMSMDEPEWIEVLVEVLLSILSCESSVLRAAVQCAFRLLIENLTPSSIGQIVSVLDPDNDSNPLLQDDSDSESDESSDDDIDGKKNKNDKKVDQENGNEDSNESDDDDDKGGSSSDTEIEEDEVDSENMTVPDQLRMAVQKALGNAAPETDTESIDADEIDEDEGKKLDKALSEAFKLLRQGKNKKTKKDRKNKKTLSDFRVRVLDLIDIYLEKEPSMDIVLGMIAPLMRCLEFCLQDNQQRELESRVRKSLKMLTNVKKFSSTDGVTVEILGDYLKATIEKGSRSQFMFQAVGDMVTESGKFIVYCSQVIEGPKTSTKKKLKSPLVAIYKESLESFFHVRSCLLPIIFFHKILQTDWEGKYALVPIITDNIFSENVRQFKRHEGLELLVGFYKALNRLKQENITEKLLPLELEFEQTVKNGLNENNEEFVVKEQFFNLLNKVFNSIMKFYSSVGTECPINMKALSDLLSVSKTAMKAKRKNKEHEAAKQSSKTSVVEENGTQPKLRKRKKKHNAAARDIEPQQKKIKS